MGQDAILSHLPLAETDFNRVRRAPINHHYDIHFTAPNQAAREPQVDLIETD
jgi:hypothetical protein